MGNKQDDGRAGVGAGGGIGEVMKGNKGWMVNGIIYLHVEGGGDYLRYDHS